MHNVTLDHVYAIAQTSLLLVASNSHGTLDEIIANPADAVPKPDVVKALRERLHALGHCSPSRQLKH